MDNTYEVNGKPHLGKIKRIVGYARALEEKTKGKNLVNKQIVQIENEVERLASKHRIEYLSTLVDYGSNSSRILPQLGRIIEMIIKKEVDMVLITERDRILHEGYEVLEYVCFVNDIELKMLNKEYVVGDKEENKQYFARLQQKYAVK